jgi:hypothetical protein
MYTDKQEQLFAWLRYLYWADLAYRQWDQFAEGAQINDKWIDWWGFFARMSHFYAAEYVVIEGWRETGFTDAVIDEALNRWPDILDLLRRYRNGVYHYQPKLIEQRFMGLLKEQESAMFFIRYLHSEFCRYYWSYINTFPCSPEQRCELRKIVLTVVGWLPDDLIEEKSSRLCKIADEAYRLVQEDDSLQAKNLQDTASEARVIVQRQLMRYREMCRAFLARNSS